MQAKGNGRSARLPIQNDELAGLIMAMTSEAQWAGWDVRYGIQGDGSLIMQICKAGYEFVVKQNDNGSPQLAIVEVTAEESRP